MAIHCDRADGTLLDLLQSNGPLGVPEIARSMSVTATAARQRLNRLMAEGLVSRELSRNGRGRPGHRYSLTEKARRATGTNFTDLALVLWREIRSVTDPALRKGMLQRLAAAMARHYEGRVTGATTRQRMDSLTALFADRNVAMAVEGTSELPILTAVDCPYPELVEQDRGICAMEKMLFSQLLETDVRLSACRLDGSGCCQFQVN